MGDKVACRTDADCLQGERCVAAPGATERVCRPVLTPPPSADVREEEDALPGDDVPAPRDTRPDDASQDTPAPCPDPPCDPPDAGCPGVDLQRDPANCGACGVRCAGVQTEEVACRAGRCVILRCATGFVDANGDPSDGCEAPCDDGQLYCRDYVDLSCDSPSNAGADACALPQAMAGRSYQLIRWEAAVDTSPWPGLSVGRATVSAGGDALRLTALRLAFLPDAARGRLLPDETWALAAETLDALTLTQAQGGAPVLLRFAPGDEGALFAGFDQPQGRASTSLWLLIEEGEAENRRPIAGTHALWFSSPYNESGTPPNGQQLGWRSPVQLFGARWQGSGFQSTRTAVIPVIETRQERSGAIDASRTLVTTRFQHFREGNLIMGFYRQTQNQQNPDKLFVGQATADASLVLGVARHGRSYCPQGYLRYEQDCVHDPVLIIAAAVDERVNVDMLQGRWRLVGWSYRLEAGVFTYQQHDREFLQRGGQVVGRQLTGTMRPRPPGDDVAIPGTLLLELRGAGALADGLTLEGLIPGPGPYGLFWERGSGGSTTLRGGVYLLFRVE